MNSKIRELMIQWKNETNSLNEYRFDIHDKIVNNANVSYHSVLFFSYRMVIARRLDKNTVLIADPLLSPSVTTTRHINEIVSVCGTDMEIIYGSDLTFGTGINSSNQRTIQDYILAKYGKAERKLNKAKTDKTKMEASREIGEIVASLQFYWRNGIIDETSFKDNRFLDDGILFTILLGKWDHR